MAKCTSGSGKRATSGAICYSKPEALPRESCSLRARLACSIQLSCGTALHQAPARLAHDLTWRMALRLGCFSVIRNSSKLPYLPL